MVVHELCFLFAEKSSFDQCCGKYADAGISKQIKQKLRGVIQRKDSWFRFRIFRNKCNDDTIFTETDYQKLKNDLPDRLRDIPISPNLCPTTSPYLNVPYVANISKFTGWKIKIEALVFWTIGIKDICTLLKTAPPASEWPLSCLIAIARRSSNLFWTIWIQSSNDSSSSFRSLLLINLKMEPSTAPSWWMPASSI